MSLRYFGTDGIRGVALRSPLTLEEVSRWGAAWSRVAREAGVKRLVIGWDPRSSSGPMSEAFILGMGLGLRLCNWQHPQDQGAHAAWVRRLLHR